MASFTANITEWVKKTGIRLDLVLRKVGLDGFKGVIEKTPVDTGRARASWRVSIDQADLTVEPVRPKDSKAKNAAGETLKEGDSMTGDEESRADSIKTAKFGQRILITNNLPYIVPLEDGHSTQSEAMVARTIEELKANLASAVADARSGT
jgi:hypothetical protein